MRTQPDITLVHLQGPAPVVSPPLGCMCLLAALEAAGVRAEFRDYQLVDGPPFEPEGLVRFITDDSAGIIGIGAMVNVLPHLVRALSEIKTRFPEKTVILGGPGPASVAEALLGAYPVADIVVRGEGEEALPELVRAIQAGKDLNAIAGIVIPSSLGIKCTPIRPRIADLDTLPPPAFGRIDLARYNGAVPLELSRGCPFSCAFCETSAFWGHEVRHYLPERVADTVRAMARQAGRCEFGFVDDTFGIDRARADRLVGLLAESGARWTCSTRVERLERGWVSALSEGGCTGVFLGIESGADGVLSRIGKRGLPAGEIVDRVAVLQGRFDPITASFVWGFPFESLHDLAETLSLAAALRSLGAVTPMHLLSALPSAPLTREFASLRRFDLGLVPDLSAVPLDRETTVMVQQHVDVFSSFYYFDHPGVGAKRRMVCRHGGAH
ncbi:B12-binding domain-containing radical SAM protein [Candidatus Fermentibacteria bacterium]|nr:B12-binding domain-containing radical SAM protein [Candidatus Fermentibacteria bacterium]